MQQMRVLLLIFSNNSEYNNLDAKLAISFEENTGKKYREDFLYPTVILCLLNYLPSLCVELPASPSAQSLR